MSESRTHAGDYSIYYRTWHDESPQHVAQMVRFHTEQLEPLVDGVFRGPAVDLGCGMGFAVLALQRLGFEAEGVERDEAQLSACDRLGAPAVECDMLTYLAERSGELNAVLLLDVLEHLPVDEHIAVLTAVRRSLRPGGRLVITVPNAVSPLASYWRYNDHTHTTSFTVHSLRYVLLNAGFSEVGFVFEPVPSRPSLRLWKKTVRRKAVRWALRRTWFALVESELGDTTKVEEMPLDLNLTCVAS